jgi:hypothetical protein
MRLRVRRASQAGLLSLAFRAWRAELVLPASRVVRAVPLLLGCPVEQARKLSTAPYDSSPPETAASHSSATALRSAHRAGVLASSPGLLVSLQTVPVAAEERHAKRRCVPPLVAEVPEHGLPH